jgi:hypothetical protein
MRIERLAGAYDAVSSRFDASFSGSRGAAHALQPRSAYEPVAPGTDMPSLFRFLTIVAVIAGVIYGGMFLLASLYTPSPREITVSVPIERDLKPK